MTRAQRVVWGTVAALLLALVAVAGVHRATGGQWFVVTTPSMGEVAPVGTLVVTRPTDPADVAVGSIVSFRPPTDPATTYTHRVIARTEDGGLTTRGDVNGAVDPWTVRADDLVGEVVARGWGLGYLVEALPLLLVGGATLLVGTQLYLRPGRRGPVRVAGFSLLGALALWLVKPLAGIVVVTSRGVADAAEVTVVSTGLLPLRVRAPGSESVDLRAGQLGTLTTRAVGADGRVDLVPALHLSWLGWAGLALVCAVPLLWTVVVGTAREEAPGAV